MSNESYLSKDYTIVLDIGQVIPIECKSELRLIKYFIIT